MTPKDIAIMQNIKALAAATLTQAAKDYCDAEAVTEKKKILKDLNGDWMDFLTSGTAKSIARELQHNERKIKKRLNINIGVN